MKWLPTRRAYAGCSTCCWLPGPSCCGRRRRRRWLTHAIVEEAEEELPDTLESDEPLPRSRHGMYGCIPPGLTTWERKFADLLDGDTEGTVRWWHRNLPHKAWSVQVMLDNGHPFFPDFVVGIEGRHTEDGALLTDPKFPVRDRRRVAEVARRAPALRSCTHPHASGRRAMDDHPLRRHAPAGSFRPRLSAGRCCCLLKTKQICDCAKVSIGRVGWC